MKPSNYTLLAPILNGWVKAYEVDVVGPRFRVMYRPGEPFFRFAGFAGFVGEGIGEGVRSFRVGYWSFRGRGETIFLIVCSE